MNDLIAHHCPTMGQHMINALAAVSLLFDAFISLIEALLISLSSELLYGDAVTLFDHVSLHYFYILTSNNIVYTDIDILRVKLICMLDGAPVLYNLHLSLNLLW